MQRTVDLCKSAVGGTKSMYIDRSLNSKRSKRYLDYFDFAESSKVMLAKSIDWSVFFLKKHLELPFSEDLVVLPVHLQNPQLRQKKKRNRSQGERLIDWINLIPKLMWRAELPLFKSCLDFILRPLVSEISLLRCGTLQNCMLVPDRNLIIL